jgi:hypothetical protein
MSCARSCTSLTAEVCRRTLQAFAARHRGLWRDGETLPRFGGALFAGLLASDRAEPTSQFYRGAKRNPAVVGGVSCPLESTPYTYSLDLRLRELRVTRCSRLVDVLSRDDAKLLRDDALVNMLVEAFVFVLARRPQPGVRCLHLVDPEHRLATQCGHTGAVDLRRVLQPLVRFRRPPVPLRVGQLAVNARRGWLDENRVRFRLARGDQQDAHKSRKQQAGCAAVRRIHRSLPP